MRLIINLLFFILPFNFFAQSFADKQLKYKRVRTAKAETNEKSQIAFNNKGFSFPPKQIYIRAFKFEEELEVWVKHKDQFKLFKTYPFCAASGTAGPKRIEGDLQVPEGLYHIDRFNPSSRFYLSLGLNYPNTSDKKRSDRQKPGGDIFIHGNCVSIGCIAITDELIKELYWLCTLAKTNGQNKIPVHIFPYCFEEKETDIFMKTQFPNQINFWKELEPFYHSFEENKKLPSFRISSAGAYLIN